ncbi:MAG: hypothetical protein HRT37_26655 [Alteromonadaceae bacterium]|nr:hypothetical protein [Alteromonadaceae bacterium]
MEEDNLTLRKYRKYRKYGKYRTSEFNLTIVNAQKMLFDLGLNVCLGGVF